MLLARLGLIALPVIPRVLHVQQSLLVHQLPGTAFYALPVIMVLLSLLVLLRALPALTGQPHLPVHKRSQIAKLAQVVHGQSRVQQPVIRVRLVTTR